MQNKYEHLNENWFLDPDHSRQVIWQWQEDYISIRPHSLSEN
ncbi:MAG: transposase [Chlorobiaceae bacterium]|nr:transposase [Chlorobiaceae bacterium]